MPARVEASHLCNEENRGGCLDPCRICFCSDDHLLCHPGQSGFVLGVEAVLVIARGHSAQKWGCPGQAGGTVTLAPSRAETCPGLASGESFHSHKS